MAITRDLDYQRERRVEMVGQPEGCCPMITQKATRGLAFNAAMMLKEHT
jgi:hypothetical protein